MKHEDAPYHDGSFANWAKEPSPEFPFHYADATSIYLSPFDERPDDNFLTDRDADPRVGSVPEEPDGDQDQSD